MKKHKKIQTPEQKWTFKRHFYYKGVLTGTKTRIYQMLLDNNNKKFLRPTLSGEEIKKLCSIIDVLNDVLKKYAKNTDLLKNK